MSSDRQGLLTAADVHKCVNTIKALNLLNIKLPNKKDELFQLRKMRSTKICLKEDCYHKVVEVNESAFLEFALKAVAHDGNESEVEIQSLSKCGTNFRRQGNQ